MAASGSRRRRRNNAAAAPHDRFAQVPPYLKDPEWFRYFPSVTLIARKEGPPGSAADSVDSGSSVFRLNLLPVAAASSRLRQLLLQHAADVGQPEEDVCITTELSSRHLELFVNFLVTGCLAGGRKLRTELADSFRTMGVDLDGLEFKRVKMGRAEAEAALAAAEVEAEDLVEVEGQDAFDDFFTDNMNDEEVLEAMEAGLLNDPSLFDRKDWIKDEMMGVDDGDEEEEKTDADVLLEEGDFQQHNYTQEEALKRSLKSSKKKKKKKEKDPAKPSLRDKESVLKCKLCPYVNRHSAQEFRLHVIKTHKNPPPNHEWFCMFCEAGFETKNEMKEHENLVHPTKRFQCNFCPIDMGKTAHRYFLAHEELHCGTSMVFCIQCGKSYHKPKALQMHMNIAGPYHNRECVQCHFELTSWTEHKQHIDECHGGVFKYVCGLCPLVFDTRELKQAHFRKEHKTEEPTRMCDMCGVVVRLSLFKAHKHLKHGVPYQELHKQRLPKDANEKEYEFCPVCGGMFKPRFMDAHMAKHREPREYEVTHLSREFLPKNIDTFKKCMPCEICGKSQLTRASYIEHYGAIHLPDGRKPYQCSYCPKGFGKKRGLKDHENIHKNLKPYKCSYEGCDTAFSHDSNRTAHENGVHKGQKRAKRERKK